MCKLSQQVVLVTYMQLYYCNLKLTFRCRSWMSEITVCSLKYKLQFKFLTGHKFIKSYDPVKYMYQASKQNRKGKEGKKKD